jgi:hypothetical protein
MRTLAFALALLGARVAGAEELDYRLPSGDVIPGTTLSDSHLGAQVSRVRDAVRKELGVDIGTVPISVVTQEELRALHAELGGKLKHNFSLYGFELEGHVFVRRALAGVPDEVLIHESLHALSERFNAQVAMQGAHKLVEGITQYLTLQALTARPEDPRRRTEKNATYVAYTELADTLATLVGEKNLRDAYFGAGFAELDKRVDAAVHGRHVLGRAARLLEAGDERAATALLTGAK